MALQESSFAHVGVKQSRANDYSVHLTQADFSSKLVPLKTSPAHVGSPGAVILPFVNANRGNSAGLQRRRAQISVRALANWRQK